MQTASNLVATDPEPDEAPPGTDVTSGSPGPASPLQHSGGAGTSYAQHSVFWQPSAYHAPPMYAPGWYYQDVSKTTQGPFTTQQLKLWRQHLPMDLLVWYIDENGGSSHSLELAKILGDGKLLESWRQTKQANVRSVNPCGLFWNAQQDADHTTHGASLLHAKSCDR